MGRDPLEPLDRLATKKFSQVTAWIASLSPDQTRGMFIDVCRALE